MKNTNWQTSYVGMNLGNTLQSELNACTTKTSRNPSYHHETVPNVQPIAVTSVAPNAMMKDNGLALAGPSEDDYKIKLNEYSRQLPTSQHPIK